MAAFKTESEPIWGSPENSRLWDAALCTAAHVHQTATGIDSMIGAIGVP